MSENPFETHACEYDAWYDAFPNTFSSEILGLRSLVPPSGKWVEVGVGTGRFAEKLGIQLGVEPATAMATLARTRGIETIPGKAEDLPLDSESCDAVFFIATLCFVTSLPLTFVEALRILRPGGCCVVGLLPLDSPLGRMSNFPASSDAFLTHAQLRTTGEVLRSLRAAGFGIQKIRQTLIGPPAEFEHTVQSPTCGHGRGSFVIIRALKGSESPQPHQLAS